MKLISQADLKPYEPKLIEYRRYLHQHPELSFEEFETSAFIQREMQQLSHAIVTKPTETSVLVQFKTGKPGPKIGLRADIDALAITEERTDIDFISQNPGKMHACGHDAHTAILMMACHYFNDHFEALTGEVWAIFQHAEEKLPGAHLNLWQRTSLMNLILSMDIIFGHYFQQAPLILKMDL